MSSLTEAGAVPIALDLREAYRQAVDDAVATLEERAACFRWGGSQIPTAGVVAAAFEHVANDAGQPHLHTHVVLANLAAKEGGGWGCLVGSELWRWREGIGAGFHLALRSGLADAGFGFRWEISEGGLGEILSVPAEVRSVASSRSRAIRAGPARSDRCPPQPSGVTQASTRQTAREPGLRPGTGPGAGWGPEEAMKVLRRAEGTQAVPSPPPAPAAVAGALATRGTAFTEPEVLVALAETMPSGLDLRQATAWARAWCNASYPLAIDRNDRLRAGRPAAHRLPEADEPRIPSRRWTTNLASQLDQRVLDLATEARFARMAEVMPALAEAELGYLCPPARAISEAVRLACGPEGVAVLPRGPWLAQAACIDAARARGRRRV